MQEKLLDKIEEVEALQRELTELEGAALDVGDHELILQLEEQIKALEHEVEHQKKKAKNYGDIYTSQVIHDLSLGLRAERSITC